MSSIFTVVMLLIKAGFGMQTCCHGFKLDQLKFYLYIRLLWDGILVLVSIIFGLFLRKISPVEFFMNIVVLFFADGYLNLIIWSYIKQKTNDLLIANR